MEIFLGDRSVAVQRALENGERVVIRYHEGSRDIEMAAIKLAVSMSRLTRCTCRFYAFNIVLTPAKETEDGNR